MTAPFQELAPEQLEVLRRYHALDTPSSEAFDDLTRTIAHVCRAPIAAITLVDQERHWLKSHVGLEQYETDLDVSLCGQAIIEAGLHVIRDTTKDERVAAHPMVVGEPFIRFYAGAPLETAEGWAIGALCVLDHEPRELADPDLEALQALARHVMLLMELGRANVEQAEMLASLDQVANEKALLLHELQHRVRNNLQMIESLLTLQLKSERRKRGREALQRIHDRLRPLLLIDQQLGANHPLGDVDLAAFLAELCDHLVKFHGGAGSAIHLDAKLEPTMMPRERAVSVGLIVNEFVTNSFKHAFAKRGGRLSVSLRHDQERVSLALADDGPGLPPGSHEAGLGLRIIPALVEQIDGSASWHNGTGTQLVVTW